MLVYEGFESGAIRPPSEAHSLLIRITRNCPWNQCAFCPVYKGTKFSRRPKEHIIKDIRTIHTYVELLRQGAGRNGDIDRNAVHQAADSMRPGEERAFYAAAHWLRGSMTSIFLQDANSLIIKPSDLTEILNFLKQCFPWVERITSYARAHTVSRMKDEDLASIREAGLNRIHIGLESGSEAVLDMMKKGATGQMQIQAGLKVKKAGMELSEYIMPGLGGIKFSREHAIESAEVLNRINPDFIRLRTLAVPESVELYEELSSGKFEKCPDVMTAREIMLFLERLDGITSILKSDHILNLFEELEGKLPEDKEAMLGVIRRFLDMSPDEQLIYQVGRRMCLFKKLDDLQNPQLRAQAEQARDQMDITPVNLDGKLDEIMARFL
ncbi:radical SAM protein [Fibrobacterota bacterium]